MKNKINKEAIKKQKAKHRHVYSILTGLGIIIFWRGIWGILDAYLLPGHQLLSYLISIMIGLLILYLNDFALKELE